MTRQQIKDCLRHGAPAYQVGKSLKVWNSVDGIWQTWIILENKHNIEGWVYKIRQKNVKYGTTWTSEDWLNKNKST